MYPTSMSAGLTESPDLVLRVENALEQNEETRGSALDILARGGTIVLMGHVGEDQVKTAAERVTSSVRGVIQVENLIQVGV